MVLQPSSSEALRLFTCFGLFLLSNSFQAVNIAVRDVNSDKSSTKLYSSQQDTRRICNVFDFRRLVPYQEGLQLQQNLQQDSIKALVGGHQTSDALILLEHPTVYTLGSSSVLSDILFELPDIDITNVGAKVVVEDYPEMPPFSIFRVQRGGKVTYHCPGQLVVYPILDLNYHGKDIERYLRNLEQLIINTLARFGVRGAREEGLTGVWISGKKVAAIGIGASRWITMHGIALNINALMKGFEMIVPCGIKDRDVTSLHQILGDSCPSVEEVKLCLKDEFAKIFELQLCDVEFPNKSSY
ncbi:hypothetical protein GUITHDRAFT_150540 [Guillardia theta CCMP2712]|uniref:lipoyl(octanoyl) transferase n=4 Tax=Guillardia theta TaxID=55529 RepID=L1JW27_GUITC|nr:hypothetical protein GUITHDRAFT_150540 [Guillardia theta CCMP2712]EKX52405.1 hypothetical protein GUITHDRAFT_150540 [Guillardia theta CCMP2712]|mmetsp:Transcript_23950/g.77873  ORF Transcript_23950/g.77873 Transcript_23950/m.77873 type:complete len:299 (+) Transcript_23950:108-1004(+)|eukprot:XP_005839385.1 hypothetical protein GUITHDRAFT_150540 [Guillardia theta CCMP2712]